MSFRTKLENSVVRRVWWWWGGGGAVKTRKTVRETVMVKLSPLVWAYNVVGI